jgi:hypothetical protein
MVQLLTINLSKYVYISFWHADRELKEAWPNGIKSPGLRTKCASTEKLVTIEARTNTPQRYILHVFSRMPTCFAKFYQWKDRSSPLRLLMQKSTSNGALTWHQHRVLSVLQILLIRRGEGKPRVGRGFSNVAKYSKEEEDKILEYFSELKCMSMILLS